MKFIHKIKRKMGMLTDDELNQESQESTEQQEETLNTVDEGVETQNTEEAVAEEVPEEELDEWGKLELSNEKLKQEMGEMKDKYLRLFADFDNHKKRTARERIDLVKTAGQKVLRDLLPVLDDFERAMKANDLNKDEDLDGDEGMRLIYNKLKKNLAQQGLTCMESMGEPFDPELHEAITEIPAPSDELKGKIVDVIEQGYYLNDKIIRHAKVVIGR